MTSPVPDPLADARTAAARGAWSVALAGFREVDSTSPLGFDDLERAGFAAQLTGHDEEAVELWGRAYHEAIRRGDVAAAARRAFWLGMMLAQRGEVARGGGWLGRAGRLVEEHGLDTVERGYLLVPQGLQRLDQGDPAAAFESFAEAARIAERFDDPDLGALGRLGRGRALIDQTHIERGVALLDEAMLAVTSGEVSPIVVGVVYCAAIEGFQSIFDLRRAQEWTDVLRAWCDSQPDLVPFRGRCLVYRAELMQLHGAWSEAIDEARQAQEWLSRPPPEPAVGEAHYRQAELRRLRGDDAGAEAAYRDASEWGRRPEPGLALLRLAQGQRAAAAAMIERALDEALDEVARGSLLEPSIEIALAGADVGAARSAADELVHLAGLARTPLLTAIATRADGLVRLAEGDPKSALRTLRQAADRWREIDAPYESARVRVGIGQALDRLGDADAAALEFEVARRVFDELGAAPDLARLDALTGTAGGRVDGLSEREAEVLRLVAAGKTNRTIGTELGISERTVDRHVSNIFTKIDVSSRAAATAYAYEHGLVQ